VDVSFFLFSLMFNQNIITEPSSETTDFSLVTHGLVSVCNFAYLFSGGKVFHCAISD